MKKIIILILILFFWGCSKGNTTPAEKIEENPNQSLMEENPNQSLFEIIYDEDDHPCSGSYCIMFEDANNDYAAIVFAPDGVRYEGNIPFHDSARMFFQEVNKLLCGCYCNHSVDGI